jgi:16S rRNA (guanine527-N7)-methyltransferase
MSPLERPLRDGLAALELSLSDAQVASLLGYLDLIGKWNRVYNLTAVRDPAQMLTHHLLDCLAAVGPLRRQTQGLPVSLLDVGAGAGLPGIVFAICCPEIRVRCADSVAKKTAFVQQVAASLKLPNLQGSHVRVETVHEPYEIISARAFSSLADLVGLTSGALAEGGAWLAMKGRRPDDEIAALPVGAEMFHVEPLRVPGLDAERCIVWMRRAAR